MAGMQIDNHTWLDVARKIHFRKDDGDVKRNAVKVDGGGKFYRVTEVEPLLGSDASGHGPRSTSPGICDTV